MKIRSLKLLLLLALTSSSCVIAQKIPDPIFQPKEILSTMQKVADWQIAEFEAGRRRHPLWDWTNGALYTGIISLAQISKNEKYFQFLRRVGKDLNWDTGPRRFLADDYCVGQMFCALYNVYKDPKMIAKFRGLADSIFMQPHTESLEWKNDIFLREWAWCDALFMGPTSLAYLSTSIGDPKYLQTADKLWWKTTDYLFDPAEDLYFRDSRYFNQKEANGQKMFWSRGNGWVMGGLVRVLENMPANYPSRSRFEELFKKMAKRTSSLQHADGSWHSALLDSISYKAKETSGTGFYCYALAWGIRNKLLPAKEYLPAVRKAWNALTSSVHTDGKLGFVQQIGEKPGSVEFNSTEVYGVGSFLLAGSEVYRLAVNSSNR